MAATARRTTATKKAAAKPAPKPAEVEIEEELDDLEVEDEATEGDDDMEELEEDEVEETKPTAKKKAGDDIVFGIQDLVALIKSETGETTDPRAIRTLIRKMARDETGRVNRVITPGNRTRYNWTGPNDPEVRNIVKAFKAGELAAEQQAKLTALKEQKAAKTAAKKAAAEAEGDDEAPKPTAKKAAAAKPAARRVAKKAAPVVEEVEDDEELDFDDAE